MRFCRRWFLILSALVAGGGSLLAASAKEDRAFAAAAAAFHDEMWSRAETQFAQFVQDFPKSTNAPLAVLLQAQAEFRQEKLVETIALLDKHKSKAGMLADQYVYWTGEAQFEGGDFPRAAGTFTALADSFPDSPLRLKAVVESAAAHARLGDWPQVIRQLQDTNGVFQPAVRADPANQLVWRGQLLLAQAEHAQKNFAGEFAALDWLTGRPLTPEVDLQRASLLCRNRIAVGDFNAALAATTNLLQIAQRQNDDVKRAEARAFRAEVLEELDRPAEAIAAYRENLATNTPAEQRRQAILKVAELDILQNNFTNAEQALEDFLGQFPDAVEQDIAGLTRGELHLKLFAANPAATNQFQTALARLNEFLSAFTNSPLAGKAHLDRGWCFWIAGKFPESLDDFRLATQQLPLSEDLAVAWFKTGDALFAQQNYDAALTNYVKVLTDFPTLPAVGRKLGNLTLSQILRVCIKLNDESGTSKALSQLLKIYPTSELAQGNALLAGQGLMDMSAPTNARAVFQDFGKQWPNSPLRPQAQIAVARTYELEQNWAGAIATYEDWLDAYPTNELRAQVEYSLARANFQAGFDSIATTLFTRFVADHATNSPALAPLAQWWLADHCFGLGDFVGAETNYERVYQSWPASELAYPARLMAGRAAMGRFNYAAANQYFTGLINDSNCPTYSDTKLQARFAYGAALMRLESSDTNNPMANVQTATNIFSLICKDYPNFPTNEPAARAWGEIGDCDAQLTDYASATNAYARAISLATNNVLRSRAQVGWGMALEKSAEALTGTNQIAALQLAVEKYTDVFYDDQADAFWRKKAGLQALPLIEALGAANPDKFITTMEILFPQAKESLEKKRAGLPPAKN